MPCDYSKYPPNWKTEIRPSILESANHCCEFCGAENYAIGYRDENKTFHTVENSMQMEDWDGPKLIKIILTIAHLVDPNPMNCSPVNLAALCQRCHNRLDAPMRRKNAKATREKKKGILKLF